MILLCDTRQKKGKHLNIERYCSNNNITMIPQCLNVGDYMLEKGTIAVDTKKDIGELANDLYRDKCAFFKKYKKCLKDGISLCVLVEEPIRDLNELCSWTSNHTKINGRYLLDLINFVRIGYNVRFYFCSKKDTGKYLIKILKGDANEKNDKQ